MSPLTSLCRRPPRNVVVFDSEFCATHIPHLRKRLRRMGFSPSDIDDLVQQTFVIAQRDWKAKPRMRKKHRNWLEGIAWRIGMNFRREARNRRESQDDDFIATLAFESIDLDERLDAQQMFAHVGAHILADDCEILFEYFVDGDSITNIAERRGLARSTIWSRLQKYLHFAAKRTSTHGVKRME